MLSLTKKTHYALIALSYLAERTDHTVSAREIAAAFDMPAALVMNILKTLHHNGMLSSTRGTKGGYKLTSDLGAVSVYGLIQLLEGPIQLTDCSPVDCDGVEPKRCKVRNCPLSKPVQALHKKMVSYLDEVMVSDIISNGHVRIQVNSRGHQGQAEEAPVDGEPLN